MARPLKYHSEEERAAARREARRRWREKNKEKWASILARNYLRRKNRLIPSADTLK